MTWEPNRAIFGDSLYDDEDGHYLGTVIPARQEAVDYVLGLPVGEDGETRSGWKWLRLVNGDLILGVFPRDEAYFIAAEEIEGGQV